MCRTIKTRISTRSMMYLEELVKEANRQETNRLKSKVSYSEVVEDCINKYCSQYFFIAGDIEYMMIGVPHRSIYKEDIEALLGQINSLEAKVSQEVHPTNLQKLEVLQCIQENKNVLLTILHNIERGIDAKVCTRKEVNRMYIGFKRTLKVDLPFKVYEKLVKICAMEGDENTKKLTMAKCIERVINLEYKRTETQRGRSEVYMPLKEMELEQLQKIEEILEQWFSIQDSTYNEDDINDLEDMKSLKEKLNEVNERIMIIQSIITIKEYINIVKESVA